MNGHGIVTYSKVENSPPMWMLECRCQWTASGDTKDGVVRLYGEHIRPSATGGQIVQASGWCAPSSQAYDFPWGRPDDSPEPSALTQEYYRRLWGALPHPISPPIPAFTTPRLDDAATARIREAYRRGIREINGMRREERNG